jgi:hypothetical protein
MTLRQPADSARRGRMMPRWIRELDALANRRINASSSWHAHDRAYSRQSRSADRGLLWYAIASTLALLGQRRGGARRGIDARCGHRLRRRRQALLHGAAAAVERGAGRPAAAQVPDEPVLSFWPLGQCGRLRRRSRARVGSRRAHRGAARGRRRVLPPARGRTLALRRAGWSDGRRARRSRGPCPRSRATAAPLTCSADHPSDVRGCLFRPTRGVRPDP